MPKNLHYLTDRLPKPNYMIEMRDHYKNNTMKEEAPSYSGTYNLNSGSLPKISGIPRINPVINRKVVKTKIVHMNINPIIERAADRDYQKYKRSPIRHHQSRNISLPPLLK